MPRLNASVSCPLLVLFALLVLNGCSDDVERGPKKDDGDRGSALSQSADAAPPAKSVVAAEGGDGGASGKGSAGGAAGAADPSCLSRCNAGLGRACGANNPCDSLCETATAQGTACLERLATCDKLQMLACLGVTPGSPGGK